MGFQLIWTKTADVTFRQLEAEAREAFESRQRTQKKKASRQEGLFKQVSKAIELLLEKKQ